MKLWQLVLVQLWVIAFAPVWAFMLAFAPMTLSPPNPAWPAFVLMVLPPGLAVFGSMGLWLARIQGRSDWQRWLAIGLFVLPLCTGISAVPSLFGR